jgi:hypothetical protein
VDPQRFTVTWAALDDVRNWLIPQQGHDKRERLKVYALDHPELRLVRFLE